MTATTLTPDAIRAMPAGREMDALVAVRLMGWSESEVETAMLCDAGSIAACAEMTTGHVPNYSADIAAAWPLMEKCGLGIARANGGWTVFRIRLGEDFTAARLGVWPLGWWESAPEAICKAALIDRLKLESLCSATT